jgi:hypothetical protein
MNKIIIDVTKTELNLIREALSIKHAILMDHLDDCEIKSRTEKEEDEMWDLVKDIAESEFEKELEKVTGQKHSVFSYKPVKDPAPHGYKKDGTPKKKPGRKV